MPEPTTPQLPAGLTIKGRKIRLIPPPNEIDTWWRIGCIESKYETLRVKELVWREGVGSADNWFPTPESAAEFCYLHADLPEGWRIERISIGLVTAWFVRNPDDEILTHEGKPTSKWPDLAHGYITAREAYLAVMKAARPAGGFEKLAYPVGEARGHYEECTDPNCIPSHAIRGCHNQRWVPDAQPDAKGEGVGIFWDVPAKEIAALIDRHVEELTQHRERADQSARDWAEDHSHLQALCRAAGVPEAEVTGEGYVPGIRDLADKLAGNLKAERERAERAEAERDRLIRGHFREDELLHVVPKSTLAILALEKDSAEVERDNATAKLTAAEATIGRLREALTVCLRTFGHEHWDHTMRRVEGCELCIQQRDARRIAEASLSESEGTNG